MPKSRSTAGKYTDLPDMTVDDVAVGLQINYRAALDLVHAGAFPDAYNVGGEGNGSRYRVPRRSFDAFRAARRIGRPLDARQRTSVAT